MQDDFWREKWQKGETGFHQENVNPWLEQYWPSLKAAGGVFVPLCGKSRDMLWLRAQGHSVLGVELSDIAVNDFFAENGLKAQPQPQGKFMASEADGIRILCGDFFALAREDMAGINAIYDRAALIALPPDMRRDYAQHMAAIAASGTQMLLLTIEYPQGEMQGPPFSVSAKEVKSLYGRDFKIRMLEHSDILTQDRLKRRGLSRLLDNVFVLQRH